MHDEGMLQWMRWRQMVKQALDLWEKGYGRIECAFIRKAKTQPGLKAKNSARAMIISRKSVQAAQ